MNPKLALVIIIICLAIIFPLQTNINKISPPQEKIEQMLYIPSGEVVKRLSFGFEGMLADIYWLRSVQYFGRQLLNDKAEINWDLMQKIDYSLLYPLLDITTTLDPHYVAAYRFGTLFLPDYNKDLALKLLLKGIDKNPTNWRLYQNLGTLYWKEKNYKSASEAFFKGAEQKGAPYWMKIMGGVMLSQGGSRRTACQLYVTFYQDARNSNDNLVTTQMEVQIKRIQTLDQVDYLNSLVDRYRKVNGHCLESIKDILPFVNPNPGITDSCGQPLSIQFNDKNEMVNPLNNPFIFDKDSCKITNISAMVAEQ